MISRTDIENRVSYLLRRHGIHSAPVPVERIANAEGVQIVESALNSDVSGALIRNHGITAIAVNSAHAANRRRFTIAHELAHFLLEHKGDQDHVDWTFTVLRRDGKSSEATVSDEIEANAFAANLLMPREYLYADLRAEAGFSGEVEVSQERLQVLARKYQVSPAAMSYRLINLGLMSPL